MSDDRDYIVLPWDIAVKIETGTRFYIRLVGREENEYTVMEREFMDDGIRDAILYIERVEKT